MLHIRTKNFPLKPCFLSSDPVDVLNPEAVSSFIRAAMKLTAEQNLEGQEVKFLIKYQGKGESGP